MPENLIAHASIQIAAPLAGVWDALVNPAKIKQYMFGTTVVTTWAVGSPILWKGEWEGKKYEDKGIILTFEKERLLAYTHYSPMMGKPDVPESYHTVTIELAAEGDRTRVTLSQDRNATEDARKHSEKNWGMMLEGLKKLLET